MCLSDFQLIQVLGTGGTFLLHSSYPSDYVRATYRAEFSFNKFFSFLMHTHKAYGKVFLVRKHGGRDDMKLYAMKVLKKSAIVQKVKTAEHTKTERQVYVQHLLRVLATFCSSILYWCSDHIKQILEQCYVTGARSNRPQSVSGFYALCFSNVIETIFSIRFVLIV